MAPRRQVQLPRTRDGRSVSLSTDTLFDWPLTDIATGRPAAPPCTKDYTLFIVLSASDCSSCLLETPQWNSLATLSRERLDVRGIIINSSLEEARDYTLGFGAKFPSFLGQDTSGSLWRSLDGLTPIKILVDKNRRPIIAETGGSPLNTLVRRVSAVISGQHGQ